MERIRVLIADDHPVFRGGLRTLLSSLGEAEVVGEAATGAEAVKAAEELQPDVVVMDLHMPELNGIEATRQIVAHSPHIGVLVLTMFEDDDSVFAAMRAGAKGYLLKGADQDDIVRAIAAVGSGEAIFGPDIAKRVIEYFTVPRASHAAQAFPRADRARARGARAGRPGPQQRLDGPALRAQPEDDPQPRLEHLHEAPGRRPRAGDRARARGRHGAADDEALSARPA